MMDLVPLILSQAKEKIKNEIAGKYVIFDSITRLGETFLFVVHFVDSNWDIHQKLTKVHMLAESLRLL